MHWPCGVCGCGAAAPLSHSGLWKKQPSFQRQLQDRDGYSRDHTISVQGHSEVREQKEDMKNLLPQSIKVKKKSLSVLISAPRYIYMNGRVMQLYVMLAWVNIAIAPGILVPLILFHLKIQSRRIGRPPKMCFSKINRIGNFLVSHLDHFIHLKVVAKVFTIFSTCFATTARFNKGKTGKYH